MHFLNRGILLRWLAHLVVALIFFTAGVYLAVTLAGGMKWLGGYHSIVALLFSEKA